MAESVPQVQNRPQVKLIFDDIDPSRDYGRNFTKVEFKGMVNGGYIVKFELHDPHFNLLTKLLEGQEGYLAKARKQKLQVTFQLKWSGEGEHPKSATKEQKAIILSMHGIGEGPDLGRIELVAIDPPSWYLNKGNAAGSVYEGKVSEVIKKVVSDYAPEVQLDIGETKDSSKNKWWMMRQDPKSFISSLVDWSPSITEKQTQWFVISDGNYLTIKEQAAFTPQSRAYYTYWGQQSGRDTIKSWEVLADNALSLVQTKVITQGCAAVSGQYLDKITDKQEKIVFAKDSTTQNKIIAKVDEKRSFAKPPDSNTDNKAVGWTAVSGIPEIYSAGDLGLRYDEYLDGRPRGMWLNMVNSLLRVKFKVVGHGEWSSCVGLGVDTIYVTWFGAAKSKSEDASDAQQGQLWWMDGNWLVYGFHHIINRKQWYTDLYCARFDYDSQAKKAGK